MSTTSPIAKALPGSIPVVPDRAVRMVSVDVFRGLIIAAMLLVTNAGSWDFVYWPLKHADWNGVTPTDMIFPSFLFLSGVSITFSFAARRRRGATSVELARHIVVRSLSLITLGVLLNGFPLYDLHNLRIPGILQRIGLCYLVAGFVYLASSRKECPGPAPRIAITLVSLIAALMVGYWALMTKFPVPAYGPDRLYQAGNLGAYIDRSVFGTNHLWFYGGQMWDPEGLLSTVTATCNMLLGILTGRWLRSSRSEKSKLLGMAILGAALLLAGIALNPLIPINKKLWTPSFMLFSGGFSLVFLALLSWIIDGRKAQWGVTPMRIFGNNAILAFSLATMLNAVEPLVRFHMNGHAFTTRDAAYDALGRGLSSYDASLGYALLFVLLNGIILWPFYRKRIFLRI
ncbi:MAG: heparan-alpha-glucosaminide N-acetyltransferase domain-containing protein [Terracidiphilus sp.]